MKNFGIAVTTIIITLVFFFLIPFLNFSLGLGIGYIIYVTFGKTFVEGLTLLNLHITPEQIPLFCGTLACIGSFFKNPRTTTTKN